MTLPHPDSENATNAFEKMISSNNIYKIQEIIESKKIDDFSLKEKQKIADLLYEQALLVIKDSGDIAILEKALNTLYSAHRVDPTRTDIYLAIAQNHLKLRLLDAKDEHVSKADEFFHKGEDLLRQLGNKMPVNFLWEWAICLYFIAKESGEAIDYRNSLNKFCEAHLLGLNDSDFLLDYGTTLGEFGVIIGNNEHILEAIQLIEASLKINPDIPSAWVRLACAYKILYFSTNNVEYYEKADHSFVAAARLDADPFILWLNWGQLIVLEGKTIRDESLLESAIDKLEKAEALKPNDSVVLASLADALVHLGALTDKISSLKEAREKLEIAHTLNPDSLDILCLLGHCLINMGKYFSDITFLNQAVEIFQRGISRNRNSYILWHGLGTAYYVHGEIEQDSVAFEKAAKFCGQAIKSGGDLPNYWNDWGVALMKLGDLKNDATNINQAVEKFEEAIRNFNRKQKGNPDPDWIYNYGCCLDFLGEFEQNPHHYERAISVLSQLHEQYPDSTHIRYNLAIAMYHLGDATEDEESLEKSIEHLQILAKKDGEDDNVLNDLGLSALTLADLYRDTFINERSKYYFQIAEQSFLHAVACGGVEGNYWLGCLYALQEMPNEALHFLERARLAQVLPTAEDLLQNEWLDSLRHNKQFLNLLESQNN